MYKKYIFEKYGIDNKHFVSFSMIDSMKDFLSLLEGDNWILKGAMNLYINHDYKRGGTLTKDIDISLIGKSPNSFATDLNNREVLETNKYIYDVISFKEIKSSTIYKGITINIKAHIKEEIFVIKFSIDVAVEEITDLKGIVKEENMFYSIERTLADKFTSMIQLGMRNTRQKDFIDLKALYSLCNSKVFSLIKELLIKRQVSKELIKEFYSGYQELPFVIKFQLEDVIKEIIQHIND
ncbi:MAG: nucleotidyl transferase AbiEii/AbiGii toxin family protein [Mycoplasmataceae bacterium]|nr:nucleotidyl transferase AbiEii/AbiGii toxin family protein [Mycoplasmataceae bacterium]